MSALLSTGQQPHVWVVDEKSGALGKRPVTLLASGTDTVRVAGLNDGDKVVTTGAQKLDARMKVSPRKHPLAVTASAGASP